MDEVISSFMRWALSRSTQASFKCHNFGKLCNGKDKMWPKTEIRFYLWPREKIYYWINRQTKSHSFQRNNENCTESCGRDVLRLQNSRQTGDPCRNPQNNSFLAVATGDMLHLWPGSHDNIVPTYMARVVYLAFKTLKEEWSQANNEIATKTGHLDQWKKESLR